MNNVLQIEEWENRIFNTSFYNFDRLAIELFHFQYEHNPLYKRFSDSIGTIPDNVHSISKIPFLPIQFFKTQIVKTTDFKEEIIFESSGTTQIQHSRHYVKSIDLYKKSFIKAFEFFYGKKKERCIIGLLPSYLERKNSSLVTMADHFINESEHALSGFYLDDYEKLHKTLLHNEILQQPTLLIGVTFALLDFAEKYKMNLRNTIIMETGGMKGRRAEITREQVHQILKEKLGVKRVHSEYGMTELLSQAYSFGNGLFQAPPWMKVLVRDEDDPLSIKKIHKNKTAETGIINVIDMANIYSCAFVATDDVGKLNSNEQFEVLGRMDNADLRGCSLLTFK